MKKFVFKFSPAVWILLTVISALFAAAVVLNIYDAISYANEIGAKFFFALIVATISATLLTLIIAAIIYSRYVVRGNYLYFYFGFLYTKTDINEIFQLTHFKAQKKLVMYFNNEKYSVALIDEKRYEEFYNALKAVNPDIIFTVQSPEE